MNGIEVEVLKAALKELGSDHGGLLGTNIATFDLDVEDFHDLVNTQLHFIDRMLKRDDLPSGVPRVRIAVLTVMACGIELGRRIGQIEAGEVLING